MFNLVHVCVGDEEEDCSSSKAVDTDDRERDSWAATGRRNQPTDNPDLQGQEEGDSGDEEREFTYFESTGMYTSAMLIQLKLTQW